MSRDIKIKGIYKHFKGKLYLVEDIAIDSETLEKVVIYRALYDINQLWVRPYKMFMEEINQNGIKYRFTEVNMDADS